VNGKVYSTNERDGERGWRERGWRLRLLEADRGHVVSREVYTSLGSGVLSCRSGRTVLRGAEHEGLVENTNTPQLCLEFINAAREVCGLVVEIGDAYGGTLEDGSLG
jgi:hypothetical protein